MPHLKYYFLILLTPLSLIYGIEQLTIFPKYTELKLEHAKTKKALTWGFMGHHKLKENSGMLFHFPKKKHQSLWMFNCFTDLSVAFLSDHFVIEQIEYMEAHPEKMSSLPPINSYEDLISLKYNDPVFEYFRNQTTRSKNKVRYALEMQGGWFEEKGFEINDQLLFLSNQNTLIIKPFDISVFKEDLILTWNSPALLLNMKAVELQVSIFFLDKDKKEIENIVIRETSSKVLAPQKARYARLHYCR